MTEISKYNNISAQLPVGGGFVGRIESTGVYNAITVNILISQPSIVTVYQFPTSQSPLSAYSNIFEQSVTENTQTTFQVPVVSPWFNLVVTNISGVAVNITANCYLQEQTATCIIDAIESGGGGDASLWANYPAVDNVNMANKSLIDVNTISGQDTKQLVIDGTNIYITADQNLILRTAVDTPTPNNIEYSLLGNLTFYEGEQNINNLLGVTHSQGFTLTQNGGGVITFEDGTTMSSAGSSGGNFSTPSNQDLDMNTHKIIGITELTGVGEYNNPIIVNNDITFSGNPTYGGNATIENVSYINGNINDSLTITNVGQITSYNATTNILMNTENVQIGQNLYFVQDATTQNSAYQNPFQTQLDLNGQNIIRTTNIFGNESISISAGMDATESRTLSLTNNGNPNAGAVSKLFLKPTGVELNTSATPISTSYTAKLDTAGVFSAPQFKVSETVVEYGLDMNGNKIINTTELNSGTYNALVIDSSPITNDGTIRIQNNYEVGGANTTPASIFYMSADGITLQNYANGRSGSFKSVNFDMDGTFRAPQFKTIGLLTGVGLDLSDSSISGASSIKFANLSVQDTAYTGNDVKTITSTDGSVTITTPSANTVNLSVPTPQGITSNTFYINDNVNNVNDVLPLMGNGDIAIMSAGTFGQSTDITWNVSQSGISGSVAPLPLSFLTTANASRFTVTASQVRVANIKFQLPVFLSGNSCTVDNCDFDSALTIGTGVTSYITINNCEFAGTQTITVASTFTNICYFVNCNFLGSTFSLLNPSSSQVIFNNCAGFTTYPANATYVGINVLSAGTAQLSTNTMKSVVVGGNITYASQINMDGNNIINVNNISGRTGDPPSFTQSFEVATGAGAIQMRGNGIATCGTITQLLQGTTLVSLTPSQASSRNNWTVSIPFFGGGGSASFAMNDLGVFSTKSVTLTTGGVITYPDTTTQSSGLVKGSGTLVAGLLTIADARVTTGAICVATYADSSPVGGVLCAKVTAGQIIIESKLITDVSPVFYMYFI